MSLKQSQIDPIIALYSKGQYTEALKALGHLISNNPDIPALYNLRGACYAGIGEAEIALESYEAAVKIDPKYAEAYKNIGNALRTLGRFDAAIESFRCALNIRPDYAEIYCSLGDIYGDAGVINEAVINYELALKINPDYAEVSNNLGNIHRAQGQLEEAVKSYEHALRINPELAMVHNNLGVAYQALGQEEAAVKSYEKAISIKPDYSIAHKNLSSVKKYHAEDKQINLMKSLLSNPIIAPSERIYLNFALAKASEDIDAQDEMFNYLNEGNRLRKNDLNYTLDQDKRLLSRIRELFNTEVPILDISEPNVGPTIKPIFIVGMPRSGTSLIEQILASHTEVFGSGELNAMEHIVTPLLENHYDTHDRNNSGPVSIDEINNIRRGYLEYLTSLNVSESIITDKMPTNFMFIGFILSALPEAKIIHVNREPRATCWSIYKHYFSSSGNGYSYNLDDLAGFYCLYVEQMKFWRQSFPNKIYHISYEELTRHQEQETRKMLEYCELRWDAKCLDFHKTKRSVKTVSAMQVRKKMYQGSSESWRKYEKYLGPIIKTIDC